MNRRLGPSSVLLRFLASHLLGEFEVRGLRLPLPLDLVRIACDVYLLVLLVLRILLLRRVCKLALTAVGLLTLRTLNLSIF